MKGHVETIRRNYHKIIVERGKDAEGKRKRDTTYFRGGKREADAELARLLHELETGLLVDTKRLKVTEFLDKWLEHTKPTVGIRTHERYKAIVERHLGPALGHHRLTELRPLHISDYYQKALKGGRLDGSGGLSAQTVVHHHRVLHEALKQGVRWQVLRSNPAEAVDPPKADKREMTVLDEKQTNMLLQSAQESALSTPILVAVTTGLRLGELLGLHWSDVDLKRGKLSVTQSLQATGDGLVFLPPKTKKSRRSIPLTKSAIDALRRHRADQLETRMAQPDRWDDNDLVFPSDYGRPWNPRSFSSSWSRLRDALGLTIRFHDLRHTHATLLLRQGVHVKVVSERLGHSTVAITLDTYSHVLPDMQEDATAKLELALAEATSA